MANSKKVNPLNVFEARRVEYPPSHFEYTNLYLGYNLRGGIERWIDLNLKGRFYIGKNVLLGKNNKITHTIKVGFEESKELSYFMLACPHLKYQ